MVDVGLGALKATKHQKVWWYMVVHGCTWLYDVEKMLLGLAPLQPMTIDSDGFNRIQSLSESLSCWNVDPVGSCWFLMLVKLSSRAAGRA